MSDQHQNKKKHIIAARYNVKTKFIYLDELNVNSFLDECKLIQVRRLLDSFCLCHINVFIIFCLGKVAFNFNCNALKVNLTDNRNAHINKENFNDIVQKFSSSASFYVNIEVIEENANVPIVSVKVCNGYLNLFVSIIIFEIFISQCMEDFLVKENAGLILQAQRDDPSYSLSKNQFNFTVRLLAEFTKHRFGTTPTAKQKEAVAKTFVELFPSVRMVIIVTKIIISSSFAHNMHFLTLNINS